MKVVLVICLFLLPAYSLSAGSLLAELDGSAKTNQAGTDAVAGFIEQIPHRDIVAYIDGYKEQKPLYVYFTRSNSQELNQITNKLAKEYRDEMNFVMVDVPAGSMRAFRNIQPLVKKYGLETLPVSVILNGKKLQDKVSLAAHRKNPEAFVRKHIDAVLRNH